MENRARLLLEVMQAVVDEIGAGAHRSCGCQPGDPVQRCRSGQQRRRPSINHVAGAPCAAEAGLPARDRGLDRRAARQRAVRLRGPACRATSRGTRRVPGCSTTATAAQMALDAVAQWRWPTLVAFGRPFISQSRPGAAPA
ncbi:MAG: hypothetical protein V9G29_17790 [Burkholderiaceae bacterium]